MSTSIKGGSTLKAIDAILSHSDNYNMLGCDPDRRSWSHVADNEHLGSVLFALGGKVHKNVETVCRFAAQVGCDYTALLEWGTLLDRNIAAVLSENWSDRAFVRSACVRAYDAWPAADAVLRRLRIYIVNRHASVRSLGPHASYDDETNTMSVTIRNAVRKPRARRAPEPLHETAQAAAELIHKTPGLPGKKIAMEIGCSFEHFRRSIVKALKLRGFYNEDGYRPPKSSV